MDRDFILKSAGAFWAGYGVCTAIIAGGRVWIAITESSQKVSELLGPVAKATTRRKLAVFGLVSYVAYRAMDALLMKTRLNEKSNVRALIAGSVGVACGAFASSLVAKSFGFDIIKLGVIASLIFAIKKPPTERTKLELM